MNENERYLFDLQGFLVVENALDTAQIAALNALIEERTALEVEAEATTHRFGGLLKWGQPCLDLIDNPHVLTYLEQLIGRTVRLDHEYCDIIRGGRGPIGTSLHGGAVTDDPTAYYRFFDGKLRNGLSVVAYNLHDVNPGDGGFGCVPGSHKSNLLLPMEWQDLDNPVSCVSAVTGPAGTAVIFTEALTHGTLPWRGQQERRTIFYKYSPSPLSYSRRYYNADEYPGLTKRQRELLQAPSARY